ncbi:MAG: tRNA (adenosine(37)-N6)-dimethylallyltransferase MiaA [Acidobacteriota bacterium]
MATGNGERCTGLVLALVGPTAAGKTGAAAKVARSLGPGRIEIVNADALQAYRQLEIGTDKPSAALRQEIPHHLVDVLDPTEPYSAGEFARRARHALDEIHRRGAIALVVGGSGLYQRALFAGLHELPRGDARIRAEIEAEIEANGLAAVRAELRRVDPETEARLEAGDTQRVARALEVYRSSERSLSSWLAAPPPDPPVRALLRVGLTVPRAILYDSIAARIDEMFAQGWVKEVQTLLDRGLDAKCPAFQAIGYREITRHLNGSITLLAARDSIIRSTRRYAKRQMTWFRREPDVSWCTPSQAPTMLLDAIAAEELALDEQA